MKNSSLAGHIASVIISLWFFFTLKSVVNVHLEPPTLELILIVLGGAVSMILGFTFKNLFRLYSLVVAFSFWACVVLVLITEPAGRLFAGINLPSYYEWGYAVALFFLILLISYSILGFVEVIREKRDVDALRSGTVFQVLAIVVPILANFSL